MSELTKSRIEELMRAEAKLNALEAGGVDNWDAYDDALEEYHKENEYDDNIGVLCGELECAFGECAYEPSERGAGIAFSDAVQDVVHSVLRTFIKEFKETM